LPNPVLAQILLFIRQRREEKEMADTNKVQVKDLNIGDKLGRMTVREIEDDGEYGIWIGLDGHEEDGMHVVDDESWIEVVDEDS
jgi:hypothetical protein